MRVCPHTYQALRVGLSVGLDNSILDHLIGLQKSLALRPDRENAKSLGSAYMFSRPNREARLPLVSSAD